MFHSELELARAGERFYIVARSGAVVVGYAGLMFVVGDAHVTNIAVTADRQRGGIAKRLLATLSWEAINRGCEAMTLEVRVSASENPTARRRCTAPSGSSLRVCGSATTRTPRTPS